MKILINCRIIDYKKGLDTVRKNIIFDRNEIIDIISSDLDLDESKFSEIIDCKGMIVSPGLIDVHSHFRDPGETHKEDQQSGEKAALKGGYSTVVVMPNTIPPLDTKDKVGALSKRSELEGLKIFYAPCITKNRKGKSLVDFESFERECADLIFGFTDDGDYLENDELMKNALHILSGKLPILDHPEDLGNLRNVGLVNQGLISDKYGLMSRPAAAEIIAVKRDIKLAKETKGWIHLQHVSTEGSIKEIEKAKNEGVKITSEVSPHHLFFNENILMNSLNSKFKVNPPLRSEKDMLACVDAISAGVIDIIATDHAPHSEENKTQNFEESLSGIAWLENSFGLVASKMGFEFAVQKMAYEPGRIFSKVFQNNLGRIETGYSSDFSIVEDVEWELDVNELQSKSSNYLTEDSEGATIKLKGKNAMTISKGIIRFDDGKVKVKTNAK